MPPDPVKVQPFPPRFRHLRRLSALTLLVLLSFLLLHLLYLRTAHHLLTSSIRSLQSRHEPILPDDFSPPTYTDPARNAALPLSSAGSLITYTPAQNRWSSNFAAHLPLTPYDITTLASICKDNYRSLDLARQARLNFPSLDWSTHPHHPVTDPTWQPAFNTDRQLATLLCNSALYLHATHRDPEALDRLRDTLFLSRALESKSPLPLSHFTAVGVATLACQTLDQLAPTLPQNARPQIQSLITDLLDESPLSAGLTRALQGRRMYDLDAADTFSRNALHPALRPILRPPLLLDTRRLLQINSAILSASGSPNYPTATHLLPPPPNSPSLHLTDLTHTYSTTARMSADAYLRAQYLHLLDRRFTATALAIRLYRLDHQNHFPPTLASLTPTYLPSIPQDPLSPTNTALHYLPQRTPPTLYSIGTDAHDDHGDGRPYNPKYPYAPRTLRFDILYPLLPPDVSTSSSPPTPN